jgi:hypothetical protein
MNEQIKELCEQAMIPFKDENLFECYHFSKEKFAELIIKKCIQAASDPGDRWIVGNTWHDGVRACIWSIQDEFDLDRSFGIEQ